MSQHWVSLHNLPHTAFPIEVFGYPEESLPDPDPIFHVVISSPEVTDLPQLPRQRMRIKLVLADGSVLHGTERS
jgi:hypothetical protein